MSLPPPSPPTLAVYVRRYRDTLVAEKFPSSPRGIWFIWIYTTTTRRPARYLSIEYAPNTSRIVYLAPLIYVSVALIYVILT